MIFYVLPIYAFLLHLCTAFKVRPVAIVRTLVALLVMLVLLTGMFRGSGMGTDYFSYFYIFRDETDIEIGFLAFIRLVKSLGFDYQAFLMIVFLFSFLSKMGVFAKMSIYPYLSLMIYLGFWFLVYDMNGIRQGIALGIIGFAICSAAEKRPISYWSWCIVAVLFHYSAIVFLPFIFVLRYKCNIWIALTLIAAFFTVAVIGVDVLDMIFDVVGINDVMRKGIKYGMDDSFNQNILFSFSTVHRLFICAVLLLTIPKMGIDDNWKNVFLWAAIINVCVYLLFSSVEIIATRISLYYRFVECLSLAYIPSIFNRKSNQILSGILLCLYVLFQVYSTLSIPNNNLIPYRFCF